MSLPAPGAVQERAGRVAADAPPADAAVPNVVVAGEPRPAGVDHAADGYEGPGAGDLGRLAAAASAVDGTAARLHYPEPAHAAAGPWIVVSPLAGRIATVARGTARATVTVEAPASTVDEALTSVREAMAEVLEAARPDHEHYPVRADDIGAFTTGMTTFALDSASRDGEQLQVAFDVATTPATTAGGVGERFEGTPNVVDVAFERRTPVERAAPSDDLRSAVEYAHERVVGDAEYEWLPAPSAFSQVPAADKVAVGTCSPGAGEFSAEAADRCEALLSTVLAEVDR